MMFTHPIPVKRGFEATFHRYSVSEAFPDHTLRVVAFEAVAFE